jgi:TatA/E family protein of Tat protein translocase
VFNIGPLELVVVLVIALIVLGPQRLPEVARSVGRGMREFRTALTEEHGPDDEAEDDEAQGDESEDGQPEDGEPKKLEASYQKEADSSESSSSSSERV